MVFRCFGSNKLITGYAQYIKIKLKLNKVGDKWTSPLNFTEQCLSLQGINSSFSWSSCTLSCTKSLSEVKTDSDILPFISEIGMYVYMYVFTTDISVLSSEITVEFYIRISLPSNSLVKSLGNRSLCLIPYYIMLRSHMSNFSNLTGKTDRSYPFFCLAQKHSKTYVLRHDCVFRLLWSLGSNHKASSMVLEIKAFNALCWF